MLVEDDIHGRCGFFQKFEQAFVHARQDSKMSRL
jgi:hypothetical protein